MRILSLEPTPSPNVMKMNIEPALPSGISYNFRKDQVNSAPEHIRDLLEIDGVTGVFQVLDFISIERHPKADWKEILPKVEQALGGIERSESTREEPRDDSFSEVHVSIQKLKGIPLQVKLQKQGEEKRFGLPDRFKEAVLSIQSAVSNYVYDRKWVEQSSRYGELDEVGNQVVEEIVAAYDQKRIDRFVQMALHPENAAKQKIAMTSREVRQALTKDNWEERYAALDQWSPTLEEMELLDQALSDKKASIRRLAVVYLGYLEDVQTIPYLLKALKDSSAMVRRTAGDTLSDMGNPQAIPAMCEALGDPNKLVRWRAARFLYEVGDESAIPALKKAMDDPEFEVQLQVKMALKRIESGEEASGTVWQQMTRGLAKE